MRYRISGDVSVDGGSWESTDLVVETVDRRRRYENEPISRRDHMLAVIELKEHVSLYRTDKDQQRVRVRDVTVKHLRTECDACNERTWLQGAIYEPVVGRFDERADVLRCHCGRTYVRLAYSAFVELMSEEPSG